MGGGVSRGGGGHPGTNFRPRIAGDFAGEGRARGPAGAGIVSDAARSFSRSRALSLTPLSLAALQAASINPTGAEQGARGLFVRVLSSESIIRPSRGAGCSGSAVCGTGRCKLLTRPGMSDLRVRGTAGGRRAYGPGTGLPRTGLTAPRLPGRAERRGFGIGATGRSDGVLRRFRGRGRKVVQALSPARWNPMRGFDVQSQKGSKLFVARFDLRRSPWESRAARRREWNRLQT